MSTKAPTTLDRLASAILKSMRYLSQEIEDYSDRGTVERRIFHEPGCSNVCSGVLYVKGADFPVWIFRAILENTGELRVDKFPVSKKLLLTALPFTRIEVAIICRCGWVVQDGQEEEPCPACGVDL